MPRIYNILPGEDIIDVCLNSTGSVDNLNKILNYNGFDTWTPQLVAGSNILIPDDVDIQDNVLRELRVNKSCNNSELSYDEINYLLTYLEKQLIDGEMQRISGTYQNSDLDGSYSIILTHNFNTWTPIVVLRDNTGQLVDDVNVVIQSINVNQIMITHPGSIVGVWRYEILN